MVCGAVCFEFVLLISLALVNLCPGRESNSTSSVYLLDIFSFQSNLPQKLFDPLDKRIEPNKFD